MKPELFAETADRQTANFRTDASWISKSDPN